MYQTIAMTNQSHNQPVDPVLVAVPSAPPVGIAAGAEPNRPPPVAACFVVAAAVPNKPPPDAVGVC